METGNDSFGLRPQEFGFRVPGSGFRVLDLEFRLLSSGFRVPAARPLLSRQHGWSGTLQQLYLTESVYKVVLRKFIPTQIRQLIFILVIMKNKLTDLRGN